MRAAWQRMLPALLPDEVWDPPPRPVQAQIIRKGLRFFIIKGSIHLGPLVRIPRQG